MPLVFTQPHMFNAFKAARERDAAIAQVGENAEPDWKLEALKAVYHICSTRLSFTTDRVWAILDGRHVDAPHEPKALGAVMRIAAHRRWCRATNRYEKSVRVECHRRPLCVWDVLVPLPEWDGQS